ncbi:MAG: hypothetical protein E4H03_10300 [Myxococcales bacterium]|jgi:hypothetical protein|nr:MAG: hypothetical protein E4H03_10300 [Myxococcales bacterium]
MKRSVVSIAMVLSALACPCAAQDATQMKLEELNDEAEDRAVRAERLEEVAPPGADERVDPERAYYDSPGGTPPSNPGGNAFGAPSGAAFPSEGGNAYPEVPANR